MDSEELMDIARLQMYKEARPGQKQLEEEIELFEDLYMPVLKYYPYWPPGPSSSPLGCSELDSALFDISHCDFSRITVSQIDKVASYASQKLPYSFDELKSILLKAKDSWSKLPNPDDIVQVTAWMRKISANHV